ncbi:MAG TPA: hypothetical protein VFJ86_13950 [Usitatibacter sp.]|jgi:hypothetical protein|nr:hypothetical protein [Usitatibacter sp.]
MRIPALFLALATCGAASAADLAARPPTVDLDQPGALDVLRETNPGRYEKVLRAVDALQSETCDEKLARFFRVQLEIPDLSCTALLLTSYPPKKHIMFSVEDTAYVMNAVQYKLAEPAFIPARDVR